MNCKQVQKLLADYSVHRLRPRQQQAIAQHLAECPLCAREWDLFTRTLELVEQVSTPEPPANLWSRVEARLLAQREQGRRSWVPRWRERWSALPLKPAFAVLTVLLLLGLFLRTRLAPPPAPVSPPPVVVTNTYVQQYATLASYEPFADRAAWGVVMTLAGR
ncbi:MAG TPA: hypothetical protein EYP85_05025 [Armatimonadetes bacterium]|nr:hypothetical protein [Armatimonadota bacterium]